MSPSPALRFDVIADGIGRITFDLPGSRANTMGQPVLAELEALLADLSGRTDLRGLILRSGKPGMFIAGADLKELAQIPADQAQTRRMIDRGLAIVAAVEALPFPTVAAIDGPCLGGGLELALGFDFRLASTNPKTELGLPETKIGLIPGWGGTQRLPRVIGPAAATELICAGDTLTPVKARDLGLVFDAVPAERLIDEAVRLVETAHADGSWREARKQKRQPVGLSEDQHAFTFAVARAGVLAKTKGHLPAPPAALDAIARGCNLTLEEGLKAETAAFLPLAGGTVSRNLIAVFFMTQRLQKDPGVTAADVAPREIHWVGVVGAGIMGAGIATAHVRRGIPTALLDSFPAALEKGTAAVAKSLQARVEIGRMTPAEMVGALAHLSPTLLPAALADRDLVIEAVIEQEEVKTALFRQLQDILPADAVIASNTSTISISRMAESLRTPENFAGLHFFNPVDRMQLVEVIRGERTSDATVATLVALAKKIGKTPIVVRDCPGFVVNRILFPYLNEALVLLEEGVSPRAIDKAATDLGMPMGPITLSDVVGLDTSLYAGAVINKAFPDRSVTTTIIADLVAAGRLGQKSGAGFYSYAKGPRGTDDPALAGFLEKARHGRPAAPSPSADGLVQRLFLPMVTEASRILTEGVVRDPGDVDMGLILGTGFPAGKGGILRWADSLGLKAVEETLDRLAPHGKRYEPTEQIRELARAGKGFYPQ